ncbi:MAG: aminotransferase class I/II-fold pyridoxal phosphate-dependent enzyme [Candidatus Margulisiibacteriota bacterium]|jgi:aminotransferase
MSKFSDLIEQIPPSGIRKFFDIVSQNKDVISLGVGEPDFVTPWNIREDAIFSLEKGYTSYTSNWGLLELREQVANYLQRRFKANFNPNNEILITIGVSEGVDITLRSILNPGDEVILPEPIYVCYDPLIKLALGKVVSIDTSLTDFILTPEAVEAKITSKTKAIVLCSPNNPTGAIIPPENLLNILKLAKKHDFWILADEIYAELSYDEPYVSAGSFTEFKDRVILFSGVSKAFAMTGWRIGFLCGHKDLLSRALKIHQYSILCAPTISQYASVEALKNSKDDVFDMSASYKKRRNFFVNNLNEIGLKTIMPKGAFYCFPSIKETGLNSEEFALQLLEKENVAVVPGNIFGLGGENFVRCCYATSLPLLKEAAKRIKRFLT